jgi:NAD-dependent dihydropyrimidine dehydrogenase PreA subunit
VVCAVLCSFFTVFTGGSGVTILALGGLLYPALLRDGYRERFSLGLLTASGSLGLLLPPALPLILYGIVAQLPIENLFIGGILPGLLLTTLVAAWGVREGIRSRVAPTPFRAREAAAALWGAKWELAMPVIDFGIPSLVRRFVKRLSCAAKEPYVFAVITCGGMPGASMAVLKRLLKRQGLELSSGWILKFGLEQMTEGEWNAKITDIADHIRGKTATAFPAAGAMGFLTTDVANSLARCIIPTEDKKFRLAESCTGCGLCQRVCPVGNIKIENGKPVWQHRCQQCAACFSWCPQAAISGSCLAARTHYQSPRIKAEQLFRNEGAEV